MAHQAIETKFLGPTNYRGSRVKATCQAGSVTVAWEYGAGNGTGIGDTDANHDRAARALIEKLGWHGTWIRGAGAAGKGNVYVHVARRSARVQGRSFYSDAGEDLGLTLTRDTDSPYRPSDTDDLAHLIADLFYAHAGDLLVVKAEGGKP